MIKTEKLTLFNIDQFRKIYDMRYNSLDCEKGFFDYYDNEAFVIKHYFRKQVKLIKEENHYIGYIWHEYPCPEDSPCEIFAFKIDSAYEEHLSKEFFDKLKLKSFKLSVANDSSSYNILKKINCKCYDETYIMRLSNDKWTEVNYTFNDLKFEMFIRDRDEELRSIVQNAIFKRPGRIDISAHDVCYEENEDYYLDDFSVFLKKDDKVIGYGQIIISDNKYTIVNLGIIPQFRGMGYSKLLVRYLVDLCHERQIDDIYIKVEGSNKIAYSLYSRMGFEKIRTYSFWSC